MDAENDLSDAYREQLEVINEIEQTQIGARTDELQRELETIERTIENREKLLALINEDFDLRKRALEDNADFELTNEKLTAEEKELIQEQLNRDLAALDKERLDNLKGVNDEIVADQIETAEEVAETIQRLTELSLEEAQNCLLYTSPSPRDS